MRRLEMAALAAAAFVLAAASGAARADFDAEAWSTFRDIKAPESAAGGHAWFVLDADVWDRSTGPDLRDLRIIRDEAEDIGYAVYSPEETPPRIETRTARVLNLSKRGSEATELTLDLGENPAITNRVDVKTPAANFRCGVTVEGSDDGKAWKTLRADGAIFAFTGDVERRFTTVSFPDAKLRYLRVVVEAPEGGPPIDLTGADVAQELPAEKPRLPATVEWPVRQRSDEPVGRETMRTLDLGARHLPVNEVVFQVSGENFTRRLQVMVGDEKARGPVAGNDRLFRFRTDRYREERLKVDFPEAFGRYVHVLVHNGDDPPLLIADVRVYGRPHYVYFPFEKGRRYRLFYGNADARRAEYEYAALFPKIDRAAAVEVRLGSVEANARFIATKSAPPPPAWLVRNQWALYAGLGVAVAALALVAIRALKRPPPAEEAK